MIHRRMFLRALAAAAGTLVGPTRALAGPVTTDRIGDEVQTVPRGQLPEFAAPNTPGVRRLYQYAVEHGDELRYIPCFCGCYRFGHRSNLDCYIKALHRDGTVTFTSHAAT